MIGSVSPQHPTHAFYDTFTCSVSHHHMFHQNHGNTSFSNLRPVTHVLQQLPLDQISIQSSAPCSTARGDRRAGGTCEERLALVIVVRGRRAKKLIELLRVSEKIEILVGFQQGMVWCPDVHLKPDQQMGRSRFDVHMFTCFCFEMFRCFTRGCVKRIVDDGCTNVEGDRICKEIPVVYKFFNETSCFTKSIFSLCAGSHVETHQAKS